MLVLIEPDVLFVVVLKSKILPDNRLCLSDNEGCDRATTGVAAL